MRVLNKNLQYFGALDVIFQTYSTGKKVNSSGPSKTTSTLKTDNETSLSLTPLGLRLVL